MAGLLDIIPPEYRLYAGTMLPGNQTGTIDESYFPQEFKDQIKDQVLNKMAMGMSWDKNKGDLESYEHPLFPSGTVRKGTIYPTDYITDRNPYGTTDYNYVTGEGRSTPTGYSSVFNTLGTYGYKYNMPNAPDFSNASIDITDKYNWNPNYGTVKDLDFTGYIGEDYGYYGSPDYVKGRDVDVRMLSEFVINAIKNRKINKAHGLELLGNYLGPRASEGEGKDIKINIPVKKEHVLPPPRHPHAGYEQSGGVQGTPSDQPGGQVGGLGGHGPARWAYGGRIDKALGGRIRDI